jgi:hypothetical protein
MVQNSVLCWNASLPGHSPCRSILCVERDRALVVVWQHGVEGSARASLLTKLAVGSTLCLAPGPNVAPASARGSAKPSGGFCFAAATSGCEPWATRSCGRVELPPNELLKRPLLPIRCPILRGGARVEHAWVADCINALAQCEAAVHSPATAL